MNDDVKGDLMQRSREWLQSCVNAATRSGVPEEADLEAFILAHLDSEQARQDAAVAAAREEQREADAKYCPNCLGVGFVERPVPCPYCDDSTHDHYCPTGTQRQQCGCGAERIRATPLTSTPLADRIAELEREVIKSNHRALELQYLLDDATKRAETAERIDRARARVAELEGAISFSDFARKDAIERMIAMARESATFDLVAHLHRQRAFSTQTFGPGARSKGVCDHIRKELAEIELDPTDLKEWVDVVLLALDGAWRAGWTPEEIAGAIEAKQTKNEARTWPDWRTAAPDKAIEHVKSPVCPDCERNGGECSRHNLDQP